MEQKIRKITADLPLALYKAFQHKLIEEELTVKVVVPQLIELWVKGEVKLPEKPPMPKRRRKT